MKKKNINKVKLFLSLLLTGIITLIFALFLVKPDGIIGLILTCISALLITESIMGLTLIKKDSKTKALRLLLTLGTLGFLLEVFLIQLDGTIGLMITCICALLIIKSIIVLMRMSEKFRDSFLKFLDLSSWLP